MSFEDTRKAIEVRFKTAWGTTTPIRFENAPAIDGINPFVALTILDGEGEQISLGTPALRRWVGLIVIQIFVKADTGTQQARAYATQAGAVFDRAEFSSGNSGTIRSRIPSVRAIGVRDGWYQLNVSVPFIRDRQY